MNWGRVVICIDLTHRRISLALRDRISDLVPPDRLRYATVVTLSQNRAIVLPLRSWLKCQEVDVYCHHLPEGDGHLLLAWSPHS